MSSFSKKLEVAANISIVVMVVLVAGVIVQKYFFAKPNAAPVGQTARVTPVVGKPVNLSDQNWSAQPKTVVLALQTTCHFCTESMEFYKRLVDSAKGKNIKFVAVFPQSVAESTEHLTRFGVSEIEVKQVPISQIDVSGTPTLILTNDKGEVTNYWIGKLTPEKEMEVINQINS